MNFDEKITFGHAGTFGPFEDSGWSTTPDSPAMSWTVDHVASLNVRLAAAAPKVRMQLEAAPYTADGKISFQEMNIYMNGLWIGYWRCERFESSAHTISGEILKPRADSRLAFVIPTARVPASMGISADRRRLGFAFQSVVFERV